MGLGAIVLLVAMALGTLGLWTMQRRLIYFPDGTAPSLTRLGAGWEQVAYDTIDGLTLSAWYRAPAAGQPIVIVFSGNAGNRGDRVALGAGLARTGFGVLLTDYRGYGGNPGQPTETGLAADARAAAAFVRDREAADPVVYFGESLGAAVAVELATAEPPAVLVLRSPFTSLDDIGREHYPLLPVALLLKDHYPSLDRIGSVRSPTLVIAGDADSIIPIDQSRLVFEAAPGPKELVVVSGADHHDPGLVAGPEVINQVIAFITAAIDQSQEG